MHSLYLDEFSVGDIFETRSATLTEGQIVDYAMMWDPQPFHMNKEVAEKTMFGGLIASGFQTQALAFRLFCDLGLLMESNIIGTGMDEVRWTAPVRPGDTLKNRIEVLEARPSSSKPDRGTLRLQHNVINQTDDTVMTFQTVMIVRRSSAAKEVN